MTQSRRHYSRGFKENAVKLSYERSNISDLARELGIRVSFLYRWRKDVSTKGKESFSGNGKQSVTPEHEEVLELRKQLKCKEMELEMLKKGMLFHSDRGVQYCSKQTVNYLNAYQFKQSMSRKENCWDNAVAESFFKTLKAELIYGCK